MPSLYEDLEFDFQWRDVIARKAPEAKKKVLAKAREDFDMPNLQIGDLYTVEEVYDEMFDYAEEIGTPKEILPHVDILGMMQDAIIGGDFAYVEVKEKDAGRFLILVRLMG